MGYLVMRLVFEEFLDINKLIEIKNNVDSKLILEFIIFDGF